MDIYDSLDLITEELKRADKTFPPFASEHEGYAVILEELDELWDEIKVLHPHRDKAAIRKEATQVGAMALRFLIDLC